MLRIWWIEMDNVIVMWIVIEKWWVESEFDDLLEIDWLIDNLIELCLCWELCDWERCWEIEIWWDEKWDEEWDVELWWWKNELSSWDCWFEIVMNWIEICWFGM